MAIVVFNRVASANTSTSVLHVPDIPSELGLVSQKHSFCLDALIKTQIDTDQFVIYHMQTYEKIHDDLETM